MAASRPPDRTAPLRADGEPSVGSGDAATGPENAAKAMGAKAVRAADDAAAEADARDQADMAAFAIGDAAAFERLYARHRAALYRFVARLLGPAHAAQVDEVFQDTWMKVIQARLDFRPRAPGQPGGPPMARFRTWLFTLAHHRGIDLLRRSGREVALPEAGDDDSGPSWQPEGEPWLDWPAAGAAPAEDMLFWRRAGERLLACLAELPPGQRAVFLLHHEDDLGLAEIGVALQLGFETAKSRLRYAMTKLRLCMGAYLPPAAREVP